MPLPGTELPAQRGYRVLSFIFPRLQILQCVIYPIQFHGFTLISSPLKYYYYSPWTSQSGSKAIGKQAPNPSGQVPQIPRGKKKCAHSRDASKINWPCFGRGLKSVLENVPLHNLLPLLFKYSRICPRNNKVGETHV